MDTCRALKNKFAGKKANVAVMGLGYVGLPIALEFAESGFNVLGIENDSDRVKKLKRGQSFITDIKSGDLRRAIKRRNLHISADARLLRRADAIIVCVPTPLRKTKIPDISYIIKATQTISGNFRSPALIVLESTTYPGTTRTVIKPIMERAGYREGRDFFLAFSPERIDPGNKKYTLTNVPKLVGGTTREATELSYLLYSKIIDRVIRVSNAETAEITKLLENTFRIVNIGLINEFAMVCEKFNIDVWEVIDAAKTKPFGFTPFYPGPGIGGHCLDTEEYVFVKNGSGVEVAQIGEVVEKIRNIPGVLKHKIQGINYIKPPRSYKLLSFNLESQKPCFKPVEALTERRCSDNLLKIVTQDNRILKVTDRHPLFVLDGNGLKIRLAKDVEAGDKLPFLCNLPRQKKDAVLKIDLIEFLKKSPEKAGSIRVKPIGFDWKSYKKIIYRHTRNTYKYYTDYIRHNAVPLSWFIEAESKGVISIDHSKLLLCTGRGPSFGETPAVINIDRDFCRLVGYYLSEGCITKDKSLRVRFCFGSDEKEYIEDVKGILKTLGIKFSLYQSKRWKSFYVKVSSNIFGWVFRDILKCGVNSSQMKIPSQLLALPSAYRNEILAGLLRGDGGVDVFIGKRSYLKNSKFYTHHRATCGVNYYSISNHLFQQVVLLLQGMDIIPSFKKRPNLLYVSGYEQSLKLKDFFDGRKKKRIEKYLADSRKPIPNRSFERHGSFVTAKVKKIERISGSRVYSAEVKDTNTIVTSFGAIVHNCIPADPLYLSWKANKLGFKTKMIDLAAKVNSLMPGYVVGRLAALLDKRLSRANILLLGVTYKKDVRDLRESPALEILEILQRKKVNISYSDPYVPYLKINGIDLKSVGLSKNVLKKQDCAVLVTDHGGFDYKLIARYSKRVLDTRNAFALRAIHGARIVKL